MLNLIHRPNAAEQNPDQAWTDTLNFFRKRSPIVFLSPDISFWEQHGFVQQSLAHLLTQAGIEVIWIDGSGWKTLPHTVSTDSPLLEVKQLRRLPGRRLPLIDSLSHRWECRQIGKLFQKNRRPFIWVYGGINEQIAASLPYIDVFSVFDDPYLHRPENPLCQKANTLIVQNRFAEGVYASLREKCHLLYPPTDTETLEKASRENQTPLSLPAHMPQRAMGYIGTFNPCGLNFMLFEEFVRSLPDWTLLLCGRTNQLGASHIERLKKYKNFLYLPWRPRRELGPVWRLLDVSLLLYRPHRPSDGAFPVKTLDSLYYQVPVVATAIPKTADLQGIFPRKSSPQELIRAALEIAQQPKDNWSRLYQQFKSQMDPKFHLIQIVNWAQRQNLEHPHQTADCA